MKTLLLLLAVSLSPVFAHPGEFCPSVIVSDQSKALSAVCCDNTTKAPAVPAPAPAPSKSNGKQREKRPAPPAHLFM